MPLRSTLISWSNVTLLTPVLGVSDQNEFSSEMRSDPPFAPQFCVWIHGCMDHESTNSYPHSRYARNNQPAADHLTPLLQRPLKSVFMGESSSPPTKSPLPATSPTPCGPSSTVVRTELRRRRLGNWTCKFRSNTPSWSIIIMLEKTTEHRG